MSPTLADLPVRKVIQALESVGFAYVRTKGSHAVYRDQQGQVAVIPQHGVVKRGTLAIDPASGGLGSRRVLEAPRLSPAQVIAAGAGNLCYLSRSGTRFRAVSLVFAA